MKITRELLESMEEYRGKEPTGSRDWVPFTLDELLVKIGDREYDDIRVISGNLGTEVDVFRGETWLFTIIKYGNLYYVRKLNLPYEKYMAYITAARFPLAASIMLTGWFWKYSFQKYSKLRALGIIFLPVFMWWFSGLLPVLVLDPSKFFSNTFLIVLLSLYLGVLVPYFMFSYKGLLLGLAVIIFMAYPYKRYIYPRYAPDAREDEYDFIDEKLV